MRVMVKAAFDPYSGYGRDALDICRFLTFQGVEVVPMPTFLLPPIPRDFSYLLEQDPRGGYDSILAFGPPQAIQPWELPPLAPLYVGWTMWEKLPMVPEDFRGHGWSWGKKDNFWSHPKKGTEGIDLMLVTCPMNVEALRNVDHEVELDVLPCGIDGEQWPFLRRNIDRPMTFGMIGQLGGRKDPYTMLEAWKELYDEVPGFDAHLHLHSLLSGGIHPQVTEWLPNVEFSWKVRSLPELVDWYHGVDVLVSTSRGEGNNKPCMEHMATGGTCIASDWAGHQNWLLPGANFALPGELHWHNEEQGVKDFRVDKEALKELIVTCWKDRPRVASMGERASHWIRESHSWEKIAADLEHRLEKARASRQ